MFEFYCNPLTFDLGGVMGLPREIAKEVLQKSLCDLTVRAW